VHIQGAGKTNTVLVAHDRDTSILFVGRRTYPDLSEVSVTNLDISDIALEASPHWLYSNSNANQRKWENGWIKPQNGVFNNGTLLVVGAGDTNHWLTNVLLTNCLLRNPSLYAMCVPGSAANILLRSNDFIFRDGTI